MPQGERRRGELHSEPREHAVAQQGNTQPFSWLAPSVSVIRSFHVMIGSGLYRAREEERLSSTCCLRSRMLVIPKAYSWAAISRLRLKSSLAAFLAI